MKATSLEEMGGGAGKEVTYDVTNGKWTGYGQSGSTGDDGGGE